MEHRRAADRRGLRYPSDLTDEEWCRIAPLMPAPGRRGRPREIEFREVINAVRYLVRSGCGWRMLPVHFGHWRTVYGWFRELARRFLFQTVHDVELMLDREQAGRDATNHGAVSFHCGLMPASRATFCQRAISSLLLIRGKTAPG